MVTIGATGACVLTLTPYQRQSLVTDVENAALRRVLESAARPHRPGAGDRIEIALTPLEAGTLRREIARLRDVWDGRRARTRTPASRVRAVALVRLADALLAGLPVVG